MAKDLEKAKVGDKLLVSAGVCYSQRIAIVTHTTRTQVHCDNWKFRRDGREIGASRYSRYYATIATSRDIARIVESEKRYSLLSDIGNATASDTLKKLKTETLEQILALMRGKK
jgi:hypothetical protein